MKTFKPGLVHCPVTPFKADQSIDYDLYAKVLEFHLRNGADALAVPMQQAEDVSLTDVELRKLLEFAIKHVNGRVPVIAHVSDPGTAIAVEPRASRRAGRRGRDRVASAVLLASEAGDGRGASRADRVRDAPAVLYLHACRRRCRHPPDGRDRARRAEAARQRCRPGRCQHALRLHGRDDLARPRNQARLPVVGRNRLHGAQRGGRWQWRVLAARRAWRPNSRARFTNSARNRSSCRRASCRKTWPSCTTW